MHTAQKIEHLFNRFGETVKVRQRVLLLGLIPIIIGSRWLWIEEEPTYWLVYVASHKDSHNRGTRKLIAAEFLKESGERKIGPMDHTGTWKQALSLWMVRDEAEALQIFAAVKKLAESTYDYYDQEVAAA